MASMIFDSPRTTGKFWKKTLSVVPANWHWRGRCQRCWQHPTVKRTAHSNTVNRAVHSNTATVSKRTRVLKTHHIANTFPHYGLARDSRKRLSHPAVGKEPGRLKLPWPGSKAADCSWLLPMWRWKSSSMQGLSFKNSRFQPRGWNLSDKLDWGVFLLWPHRGYEFWIGSKGM